MDNSEPYDDDPVYLPRVILHATLRGEGTEIYREMSIYEAVALITDVHASHVTPAPGSLPTARISVHGTGRHDLWLSLCRDRWFRPGVRARRDGVCLAGRDR